MKNLVVGTALFVSASYAQIDPSILENGHSWLFRLVHQDGPTSPQVVFDGVSYTKIDTVYWRSDTLFYSTNSKDSSFIDNSIISYKVKYAVANRNASELEVQGNRPRHLQYGYPWFMIGSDLVGDLSYVRYDGKVRLLSRYFKSPGPTYGETTSYTYLQGIGLVEYSSSVFGPLARSSCRLQLLELNGQPFDSTGVEKLGSVTHINRSRSAKSNSKSAFKPTSISHQYLINGRYVGIAAGKSVYLQK